MVPLLNIAYGFKAQAAVCGATGTLKDAVVRFDIAANALLEDNNGGDKLVKADLAEFIDSCRHACTVNFDWKWVVI